MWGDDLVDVQITNSFLKIVELFIAFIPTLLAIIILIITGVNFLGIIHHFYELKYGTAE